MIKILHPDAIECHLPGSEGQHPYYDTQRSRWDFLTTIRSPFHWVLLLELQSLSSLKGSKTPTRNGPKQCFDTAHHEPTSLM